jgi:UTP--glucose-1-phosphate uridylyltransferase
MNITKAVIPAAGLGTRMLPAAKAVPKELLPVLDRPTIQYVVQEAADAGVRDVCLISSPEKRAVEQHFALNAGLNERLARGGKEKLLESINELARRVRVRAVDQIEQRGLGDAVLRAQDFVGDESFLCMLGDTIFSGDSPSMQLVEAYRELGTSVIALEEVPLEKVSRYGVAGGTMIRDGLMKIDALVEKPAREAAPSRFAVAARYVLTPAVFECLKRVTPGALGEMQLTDGLRLLLEREAIHGIVLRGKRHDIGNPLDWLKTNIVFASRDPEMWKEIQPLLQSLIDGASS